MKDKNMNKTAYLLAIVFGLSAFAQTSTQRVTATANGTLDTVTVLNSTAPAYSVANRLSFASPCTPDGTANTAPQLRSDGIGYTTFEYPLTDWSYPQVTNITGLTYKFCYFLEGAVDADIFLAPALKNKITGTTQFGPPAATVAGPGVPGTVLIYSNTVKNSSKSTTVNWTFATPISSLDIGNYEFGFLVGHNVPPPFVPGFSSVFRILGVHVTAKVVLTSPPVLVEVTSSTYTPNSTWAQGRLAFSVTMPAPSSGTGVRAWIRCGNGTTMPVTTLAWGAGAGTKSASFTLTSLNSTCVGGGATALVPGNSTRFEFRPVDSGGTAFGNVTYGNNFSL